MADETLLVISGQGVPPYSARGLTQTWEPIAAAGVFGRTINGKLINLSPPQMELYRTTISCTDQDAPAWEGVFPGTVITVDCVFEFSFQIGMGGATRPVVPFSSRIVGAWTYYRPQLVIMVTSLVGSRNEYGHLTDWQLQGEEQG